MTTGIWHVDRGEYRNAYYASIRSASDQLTPETLAKVSVPEAYPLSNEYMSAQPRILVMGQETFGNETSLALFTDKPWSAWGSQIGGAIDFDFGHGVGEKALNTPFWAAVDEVAAAFGLPSRRHLAWSNLQKVQLTAKCKGSFSPQGLGASNFRSIWEWQRTLFLAELNFIKPDAMVLFVGPRMWVMGKMLGGTIYRERRKERGFYVIETDVFPIPIVAMNHPGARPQGSTAVPRAAALEYLIRQMNLTPNLKLGEALTRPSSAPQ